MPFKRFLSALLFLIASLPSFAQDIATARQQTLGSVVTVSGIVTNGDELGIIRYVEDGSAAIAVYPGSGSVSFAPLRGDSITVSGPLKDYNGLLEIDPVQSVIVHSSGNALPVPQSINISQIGESLEGELVEFIGVSMPAGGGTFSSSTYTFTDGSGNTGTLYLRSGHPLVGTLIPLGPFNLIGIMSQFSFTGTGGYQLLPRDANDLVFSSSILFASGVEQSNISTSGFNLQWTTSTNGSTNVRYGATPNLELGDINSGGNTNSHSISLSGLTAGSIYYVQAYSENGSDTAWSNLGVYATESNSTGYKAVYFNAPVDNSVAQNVNAIELDGYFNDTIKAYIDKAQNTLEVAVYNANNSMIMTAINDAHTRGVQVRYIAEGGNANLGLSDLNSAIPVLQKPDALPGIMHNKFVVVDAQSVNNSYVISGSTNWTPNNLFDDPNNLVIIQDQSLAKTFQLEFDEMWGGNGAQPNMNNVKWGADKLDNTPHQFVIDGDRVECYFSPTDGVTSQIANLVENAGSEAQFAVLTFTRDDIAQALIDMNNEFGKFAQGIIENINDQGGEYQNLLNSGVLVKSHAGTGNQLHHKYLIVDRMSASSAAVLTGSHNWSTSAETVNDENTLIIYNQDFADMFFQEFSARYNEIIGLEESEALPVKVFPMPFNESWSVEFTAPAAGKGSVVLYDLNGRIVFKQNTQWTGSLETQTFQHSLRSGTYIMELRGDSWQAVIPVIKG